MLNLRLEREYSLVFSLSIGPHTLTVPSSEELANIPGSLEFQWTQLTVLVCPSNAYIGISLFKCQIYTL